MLLHNIRLIRTNIQHINQTRLDLHYDREGLALCVNPRP